MPDINKPMDIPELNLQPPISGKVRLSDDMQQTLALLCAMGDSKRITLRASESGALLTSEPVIKDIVIVDSVADTGLGQGADIPCSGVMIMAHPDNTDKTWVRPYKACTDTHKWPLQKWDIMRFAVDNVNRVFFLCDTPEEQVIIAYTR